MVQALVRSLLPAVTCKSKTTITQDSSHNSRSSGPVVDSISADQFRPSFISGRTLLNKLPTSNHELHGSDTSNRAVLKPELPLSTQSATKLYLHAGCKKKTLQFHFSASASWSNCGLRWLVGRVRQSSVRAITVRHARDKRIRSHVENSGRVIAALKIICIDFFSLVIGI